MENKESAPLKMNEAEFPKKGEEPRRTRHHCYWIKILWRSYIVKLFDECIENQFS